MGKRKAKTRKPTGPKKREPLSTAFTCLFCNHEKAIQVKMDKKSGVGDLLCKTCGQRFQTTINYLSAPVDVYSDWIDACEAVAKDAVAQEEGEESITAADRDFSRYAVDERSPRATMTAPGNEYDEDDDGGYDDE